MNELTLCLLILLFVEAFSIKYLNIENSELCSPVTKRKIKLRRGEDSVLIVRQTRLNDHSSDWEKNFSCKFEVNSVDHDGIFAVIQYLMLRKDMATGECIDYVQFKSRSGIRSPKFCGLVNANSNINSTIPHVPYTLAVNAFLDPKGEVDMKIFVSKEAVKTDDKMDIYIAFTAYQRCSRVESVKSILPCSGDFREECIYQGLFNDGVVNCPYMNCVDENGCYMPDTVQKESIGDKVLIASVTALILIFALFICCLWVCRMHKIMCWSEDFSNSNAAPRSTPATRIEMDERPPQTTRTPRPTAPSVSQEDKDLPPSYDSLFPSR